MNPSARVVDPRVAAQLETDGFAVVPFPGVSEVLEQLRSLYGEAHGWVGSGFEADLTNGDREYRRRVSDGLSAVLDPLVAGLFVDMVPFLRVFLCKWPGPGSDLYLHRDWMYVDERRGGRTFVVWIPLQDVDDSNGSLQVLPSSHLADGSLRGTHLNAGWVSDDDLVRPHLTVVHARAGEAVIMDNALVHCSLPNHGVEPRLVAAIGVRPADSPLVHFVRSDAEHALRVDVDEDFFLTVTPQELMANGTDLPPAEMIEISEETVPQFLATPLPTSGPPETSGVPASTVIAPHGGTAEPWLGRAKGALRSLGFRLRG